MLTWSYPPEMDNCYNSSGPMIEPDPDIAGIGGRAESLRKSIGPRESTNIL